MEVPLETAAFGIAGGDDAFPRLAQFLQVCSHHGPQPLVIDGEARRSPDLVGEEMGVEARGVIDQRHQSPVPLDGGHLSAGHTARISRRPAELIHEAGVAGQGIADPHRVIVEGARKDGPKAQPTGTGLRRVREAQQLLRALDLHHQEGRDAGAEPRQRDSQREDGRKPPALAAPGFPAARLATANHASAIPQAAVGRRTGHSRRRSRPFERRSRKTDHVASTEPVASVPSHPTVMRRFASSTFVEISSTLSPRTQTGEQSKSKNRS